MNTFEALKAWLEKYRAFMEKYNAGELTLWDMENAQSNGAEMIELFMKALFELDERTKK